MKSFSSSVRPVITILFAVSFNLVCSLAVLFQVMTVSEYVVAIGPIVATLIGFWFGERAALKVPGAISDIG